jgi:hypothetical protein
MNVTAGVLQKLLAALNECTEWVRKTRLRFVGVSCVRQSSCILHSGYCWHRSVCRGYFCVLLSRSVLMALCRFELNCCGVSLLACMCDIGSSNNSSNNCCNGGHVCWWHFNSDVLETVQALEIVFIIFGNVLSLMKQQRPS